MPQEDPTGHPHHLIEEGTRLGDNVTVAPFAVVKAGSELGDGVRVDHFAVIGGEPQSLGFNPATPSGVRVGDGTIIREGATINRSTRKGGQTVVGAHGYLMANSHVGHDCVLGDRVILGNGVLLGGHVVVGNDAFLGGNAAVHQYCQVGEGAMVGGVSRITLDVPPFVTVANENELAGLNLVGLQRRGFTPEEIADLKRCYRAVYLSRPPGDPAKKAAAALADGVPATARGRQFLEFFLRLDSRGCVRRRG